MLSSTGMLLAIVVTLLNQGIVDYRWIVVGLVAGAVIGSLAARIVAMTAMPEMVALFNGFGGLASLLVAWHAYHSQEQISLLTAGTVVASVGIGGVTFTGSLVARRATAVTWSRALYALRCLIPPRVAIITCTTAWLARVA